MKNNPFPYSLDNKRYHTWNYYLRNRYQNKVAKVPLDAGFTCPNRDGKLSYGGCTFCSEKGAGDFPIDIEKNLHQQFEQRYGVMHNKWPDCLAMAYFQAFTNTYAPLEKLESIFQPFVENQNIVAICIGTRSDCIDDECLEYLAQISQQKDVWIELGLQSIHDTTTDSLNCKHTYQQFLDVVERLSKTNCKICVHLLNGLPNETAEMMVESAREVGKLPIDALKIHMLHLVKGSRLALEYQKQPWELLTKEQYILTVIKQLEYLPANIVIQRLTGDGLADMLLEPKWTLKKTAVLNDIDKEMKKQNTWQGKKVSG